ncbi:hypothetical protein SAMD00019534_112460 [Acytostelium subglobosum LB1]|uniref:hypothetical protein n=1 Tax=Acytostelium subglobosum LB1 TaxID=1410327 RepID=UPI0006450DE5|nr:hypothetical protein SAMD00019534_112460 [Acytostelium subglobosum LB1]GAM28070.1 hypothetical protein SAMD00019534_112460 [Acytostelium subglobosum LB1]|eukprot:XP_012749029.1 hypothetical protein SAMD00019534_112460 [Acytostelium subglobosum LB1]
MFGRAMLSVDMPLVLASFFFFFFFFSSLSFSFLIFSSSMLILSAFVFFFFFISMSKFISSSLCSHVCVSACETVLTGLSTISMLFMSLN